MKILDYVKSYIDDKGIYPELDLAVIRLVNRVSGHIICKNNLHFSSSKNTKYRQKHGKYYYVQKNWMFIHVDNNMSLWYELKFKFSEDAIKYRKCMYDALKEILNRHGLTLVVHDTGCIVGVEVSWDSEGAESDYKKLSLGVKGVGSVEMLKELYTKPVGYLY